jgi:hypothetical protein
MSNSPGGDGAYNSELITAVVAVALMQATHWPALSLRRRLQFRPNAFLGHILICIGELSLFFTAALATIILFDRFGELQFSVGKTCVLAAILFSITSYKYQLMSLGDLMIESEFKTVPKEIQVQFDQRSHAARGLLK